MIGVPRKILFGLATSERFERGSARHPPATGRLPPGVPLRRRRHRRRRARGRAPARRRRHRRSIDFFGENVTDAGEADAVADAYVALADRVTAPTYLSIDLSHIAIDDPGDGARRRLERIAEALPAGVWIQVGAEQIARTDPILDPVLAVARAGGRVAATIQANLRRSVADAQRLADAGVPIRLVKGAYVETPALAHAWGDPTDIAFIDLAYALHGAGATLSLGTHDPVIREALLPALQGVTIEMLLGVRPDDQKPWRLAESRSVCTSPMATPGSGTRCAASPNPAARTERFSPRPFLRWLRRLPSSRVLTLGFPL